MTLLLSVFLSVVFRFCTIVAQTFSPSPDWRRPNITRTLAERIQIAADALEESEKMLDAEGQFHDGLDVYGLTGHFYAQMALFDRITNQTKYQESLKGFLLNAERVNKGFLGQSLDDCLANAYAATLAYMVYQDQVFLDYAETSWRSASMYTLTDSNIASGRISTKTIRVSQKGCDGGVSLAGGTFSTVNKGEAELSAAASGSYLLASALLAKATGNQTYLEMAKHSADFIHSHLRDPQNAILEKLHPDSCLKDPVNQQSWGTGYAVEGFAALASLTDDAMFEQSMRQILYTAMNDPNRQGEDGVIKLQYADMSLVRAMLEIYNRNTTSSDSDIRPYIKQYLSVQYNAVLDFGTVSGTNHYANSYIGPPQDQFTSAGQIRSQIVLLGAISLYSDGEAPASSPDPRPDPKTPHPSSPTSVNVGAIAGSIVGGSFLVGLVVFCLSRRRKLSRAGPDGGHATQFAVDPFPIELFVDEALASTSRAGRKRHTIAAPTTTPPGLAQVSARENRPQFSTEQLVDLIIARMQPTILLGEHDMPPDYSEGSRR